MGIVFVGGLGGNFYCNGSYVYYFSEEVVLNDFKGVGLFLMVSVENLRVFLFDWFCSKVFKGFFWLVSVVIL